MRRQTALILGTMLAAATVAGSATALAGGLFQSGIASVPWTAHLGLTLPAMIASSFAAWWHTRGGLADDVPSWTLASRITGGAFVLFVLELMLIGTVQAIWFADRATAIGVELIAGLASSVVVGVLGTAVLYVPALLAEYVVIHLVRRFRTKSLSSGVVQ